MDTEGVKKFVEEAGEKLEKKDFRKMTPGNWAVVLVGAVVALLVLSFGFKILGGVADALLWVVGGKLFWLALLGLAIWAGARHFSKRS